MRVAFFPSDDGGPGRYRCIAPAQQAENEGIEVSFPGAIPARGRDSVKGVGQLDADVVVIQRPLERRVTEVIPYLQERGIAVVIDMDDDFHSLHPGNSYYRNYNPQANPSMNWEHTLRSCRVADLVTLSTPLLARRYGCGHWRLIRNAVPDELCVNNREPTDGKTLGWAGTLSNHPEDLQEVGSGVRDALSATSGRFHVVGDGDGVMDVLGLTDDPTRTGWLKVDDYWPALDRIDVAIAPLAMTTFNQSKSALKPIEFAARAIPSVASATPEYEAFASQGGCVIARTPEEWCAKIRALMEDPDRAREAGAAALGAVQQHHVISVTVSQWIDAWQTAARTAKMRRRTGVGVKRHRKRGSAR